MAATFEYLLRPSQKTPALLRAQQELGEVAVVVQTYANRAEHAGHKELAAELHKVSDALAVVVFRMRDAKSLHSGAFTVSYVHLWRMLGYRQQDADPD